MDLSDEVDEFLKEIEKKYTHADDVPPKNSLEGQLHILSKEFDTLGFPLIDLSQNKTKLLEQIVCHTLLLIQIQRKTVAQVNEVNISNTQKELRNSDLQNTIYALRMKVKQTETEGNKMGQTIKKLNDQCAALKEILSTQKKDIDKIKKQYKSKENDLMHIINSLKHENERLKNIRGQNFDKRNQDDYLLTILKQHKQKEETYKCALQKLEENNAEIMNEIVSLRSELAVLYSKENDGTISTDTFT